MKEETKLCALKAPVYAPDTSMEEGVDREGEAENVDTEANAKQNANR